ncbi:hypothetical protein LguiA_014689 [Lonicera macranthoides]
MLGMRGWLDVCKLNELMPVPSNWKEITARDMIMHSSEVLQQCAPDIQQVLGPKLASMRARLSDSKDICLWTSSSQFSLSAWNLGRPERSLSPFSAMIWTNKDFEPPHS